LIEDAVMASQPSRQQRRKALRDAMERGRKTLANGIKPDITEDDATGVALVLHEGLADTAQADRASQAAAVIETALQKSLGTDLKKLDVGCRKGCSYCCTSRVIISAPEIFRVANWLRTNGVAPGAPLQVESILAEARRRDALPAGDRTWLREPCPMLVDGACGVYEPRPISCRAVYSLSSEACKVAMVDDSQSLPLVVSTMDKGDLARSLLLAAVSASGLSDRGIEFVAGIRIALEMPNAETRWLAGEPIFDAAPGADRLPQARQLQDRIAARVKALVAT
jgi:hypothetical protein